VTVAPFRIQAASLTDVGLVRERNEDAFGEARFEGGHVFVVADGMGGHAGGETASRLAVEAVVRALRAMPRDAPRALVDAMEAANRSIYDTARRDPALAGMGTTGVVLLLAGSAGWVANVGDSRVYRLRGEAFDPLTRDHSVVAEMVRLGLLTTAQAAVHPRRNEVLRSLGTVPDVDVDVDEVDVAVGDVFLLCSDGLCGVVGDPAIAALLRERSPEEACRALVEAAIGQGAPDNVTVQVVRIHARD
jgi:protein phosphatase